MSSLSHQTDDSVKLQQKETSDLTKLPIEKDGSFNRKASTFRNFITQDGDFTPEKGRYHLYVSYGCPWATRTLIVRKLKGLEDIISVSVVSPRSDVDGWAFADVDNYPGATTDPINGAKHMKDVYLKVAPEYTGRFTVPVLWDKKTSTIVNNESSEIIRMFNSEFNALIAPERAQLDLYPETLRPDIDALNAWVYDTVNNGVYKAGFARSQSAYETAVIALFDSLDRLEKILEGREFLVGDQLTEADVRLFVTIIRFDVAYHGNFKCNLRTIRDGYPNLHLWLRRLYWKADEPAFRDTCKFDHIKDGYYHHAIVNPSQITPIGPVPHIRPL